jgi:hypothetical protein
MRLARRLALAALVSVAMLALPSLAHAATYCVNDSGCAGVSEPDLQTALNAAMATTSQADTVQVGTPGPPTGSGWGYSDGGHAANQVDIIGGGASNTVLADNAGTVLYVQGAGSTISDLSVQLPNANSTGIATSGSLSNVDISSLDSTGHNQTGVILIGSGNQTWTTGSINLPAVGTSHNGIVHSGAPGIIDLEDLTLSDGLSQGIIAADGDAMTLRRVSLDSAIGVVAIGAHVTMDDLAFRSTRAPDIFLVSEPSGSRDSSADLNHVTAFGAGVPGGVGMLVISSAHSATVNVRNSIVRDFFYLVERSTSSTGAANVNTSYSDIDLIHAQNTNSGSGSGGINAGAGMIDADPLFTNPTAGDLSLKSGSPAVDAGDPAGLAAGDSGTDLLGAPRISNGRQDMGAVELQVSPPPTPPAPPVKDTLAPKLTLSKLPHKLRLKQLLAGIKFTVTTNEASSINAALSGSASSVKLAKSFNFTLAQKKLGLAAGKRRVTLKVPKRILGRSHRFTVRLTVSATDASGNVSTIRRTIKVR